MYLSVAPLEFKMMGSQILIQGPKFQTPISCFFWNEKKAIFSPFFPKLKGSGTHCSKIDGFPGTYGTHANGATDTRNHSICKGQKLRWQEEVGT